MSERPKPYVGVSGVVSPEQQEWLNHYRFPLMVLNRNLSLGIKAVHKTQWLDVPNKYGPGWYPVGDTIADSVIPSNGNTLLTAQVFLDLPEARRHDIDNYPSRFIEKLIGRTGMWLDAVQFDMLPWHEQDYSELFEEMITTKPTLDIILQCQGPIMDAYTPQEITKRLDYYRPYVSHVLFDSSHGTGKQLDVDALRPYVTEAFEREWLGVGVAGGLDGQVVVEELQVLLDEFPDLSFDAEGRLHQNLDESNRRLNRNRTVHYLDRAVDAIVSAKKRH